MSSWRRQTYLQDLRGRVLDAEGSSRRAAARFGVSVPCFVKARQRRHLVGAVMLLAAKAASRAYW